jgi:hypothetical protein
MQAELAVDLGLPPPTPFERIPEHEGVAIRGRNRSPTLAVHQQPVEYLGNADTSSALDSAVDLSVSSTFDDLLDCDMSLLEDWNPISTNSQWPSLNHLRRQSRPPNPTARTDL